MLETLDRCTYARDYARLNFAILRLNPSSEHCLSSKFTKLNWFNRKLFCAFNLTDHILLICRHYNVSNM